MLARFGVGACGRESRQLPEAIQKPACHQHRDQMMLKRRDGYTYCTVLPAYFLSER